ncbi:hypothetical protein SY94_1839 [Agrobacterium tumefaciens]|nr:hypothetical protein SY94_1839 [Agrobacterium tumefaciens]
MLIRNQELIADERVSRGPETTAWATPFSGG